MLNIPGANASALSTHFSSPAAPLAMEDSPATLFFSSLRHIALKLDRSARELRSQVEDSRSRYGDTDQAIDDPRALLKLRNMLEEVQQLKCHAEEEVVAVAERDSGLDELLHGCHKLCDQRREEMETLQKQLEKYGFQRSEAAGEAMSASLSSVPESSNDGGEDKTNGKQRVPTPSLHEIGISRKTLNKLRDLKKPQTEQSRRSPSPEMPMPDDVTPIPSPTFPRIQSTEVLRTRSKIPREQDDIAKTLQFTDSPVVAVGEGAAHSASLPTPQVDDQTWIVSIPSSALQKRMSNPELSPSEAASPVPPVRRRSEHNLNLGAERNHQTKRLLPQLAKDASHVKTQSRVTPPLPKTVTAFLQSQKEKEGRDGSDLLTSSSEPSVVSNSLASLAALAAELETSSSKQQQRRRQGQIARIASSPAELGGEALKQALRQMRISRSGNEHHSPSRSANECHSPVSPTQPVVSQLYYPSETPTPCKPVAFVSGQTKGHANGRDSPSYFEQLSKAKLQADFANFQTSLDLSPPRQEMAYSQSSQIAEVTDDEYETSAAYLRSQVPSLMYLNDVISQINAHIATERAEVGVGHLLMSELRDELGLGSKATGIQLLLVKLHRIKRYGNTSSGQVVYSVY